MNSISPVLARVPNQLASQLILGSITRSNSQLLQLQMKLASGLEISRPSDDPVGASTVSVLEDLLERRDQRLRNLSHAESMLGTLDMALGDVGGLLLEAKGVALSQIGIGSDNETRAMQAEVINSILQGLEGIANREFHGIHVFAGSAHAQSPFSSHLGGLRYEGEGIGLFTDIGMGFSTPLTISGEDAFGALSSRVEGDQDLNPKMQSTTRIADLGGARGLGVSGGPVLLQINGIEIEVDLTDAATVGDVQSRLESAIQVRVPEASVGLSAQQQSTFLITVPEGNSISISDTEHGVTGADLGILGTYPGGSSTEGQDVNPALTWTTPLDSLEGISAPMGTIRIENAGQVHDVDLSQANTLQDIRNTIEQLDIGVRVEIADSGDRLTIRNEISGASMSIGEVGGASTATDLGIRSMRGSTRLEVFNAGAGVNFVSGAVDPVTGLPDPAADMDLRISLADGRAFDVDLTRCEVVDDVFDAVREAATSAGITVSGEFDIGFVADGNGIALWDNTVGGEELKVEGINASQAAQQLGIEGSGSATIAGEDRAMVSVNGVFSHLIALRDALMANDESGIQFAAQRLEADIARVTEARAEVGVRSRRVQDATTREESLLVQDQSLKSSIQDLDFAAAAMRFGTLQQQLQAALSTAGNVTGLTILDFLR